MAAAIALYVHEGFSALAFLVFFLAPDISMLGYVAGERTGALLYDIAHFEAWPVALGTAGVLSGSDVAIQVALIWLAHTGVDRLLGYGLKYPSSFRDSHLQRVVALLETSHQKWRSPEPPCCVLSRPRTHRYAGSLRPCLAAPEPAPFPGERSEQGH